MNWESEGRARRISWSVCLTPWRVGPQGKGSVLPARRYSMIAVRVVPLCQLRQCGHCGHQITAADEAHDTCRACGINLDIIYPMEIQ